ncbi:hypothetical protein BJF90_40495 [Pseudonocardia sp. CNS-004]|nr:hypothetical protein BJF90_40495 [Pseudonocardia sp. CNS-004]
MNETTRTSGWASHGSTTSAGSPSTVLTVPAGRCRSSRAARTIDDSGATSDGLNSTGHPAARAGAILRAGMDTGKFHGVSTAATPSGRGSTWCAVPVTTWCTRSPCSSTRSAMTRK